MENEIESVQEDEKVILIWLLRYWNGCGKMNPAMPLLLVVSPFAAVQIGESGESLFRRVNKS